jgi:hypothetical protein
LISQKFERTNEEIAEWVEQYALEKDYSIRQIRRVLKDNGYVRYPEKANTSRSSHMQPYNYIRELKVEQEQKNATTTTTTNAEYNPIETQKSMGIDPGFGSSAFAIVVTQWQDSQIQVIYAEQIEKADFNQMINKTLGLTEKYGITKQNSCQIFVDGSNPSFIRSLKAQLSERPDYENEIAYYRANNKNYAWEDDMLVVPVSFAKEHKAMLSHCKKLLEDNGGQIAIHPEFEKLITSLRTATAAEYSLDKEATSYDDIFDAFRLSLRFYH